MGRFSKKLRKLTRPARHWLLWQSTRLAEGLLGRLPPRLALRLGAALGFVGYCLAWPHRRRAIENLKNAFGDEMDARARRATARDSFVNLGRNAAELCVVKRRGVEYLLEHWRVYGLDIATELAGKPGGMLLVTAHLDNWEMVGAFSSAVMGLPLLAVAARPPRNMQERWLDDVRRRVGMDVYYRGGDARHLMGRLRRGATLGILLDQDSGGVGCFAPFFGRPAFTQTGAILLALRSGASIVSIFSYRLDDPLYHELRIAGPIEPLDLADGEFASRNERLRAQAEELTRRLVAESERAIRRRPEQWVWLHNRWRRRPTDEASKPTASEK